MTLLLGGAVVGVAGVVNLTGRPTYAEARQIHTSGPPIVEKAREAAQRDADNNDSTLHKVASAAENLKDLIGSYAPPKPHLPSSTKEVTDQLSMVSSKLRDAASLKTLAMESAELVKKIPSSKDLQDLSSTTARLVQDLTESLSPKAMQDHISHLTSSINLSGAEWTQKATKLWTDAIADSVARITEGTLVARLQEVMSDKERNPELDWDSGVRIGKGLCLGEEKFVEGRRTAVAKAVGELIGEKVDPRDVPVIAIGASGGGCRAMVSTLASLSALQKLHFLPAVTYIAGVSGSTWAMASLYTHGPDFRKLHTRLAKQLSSNYLSMAELVAAVNSPNGVAILAGIAGKYFGTDGKGEFSTVDVFGTLLTARLLVPEIADDMKDYGKLSHQKLTADRHSLPLPIYTAVSHDADDGGYRWWEFTPYEVGCSVADSGSWVPTWAFGRRFEDGECCEKLPEQSLGLLLGTFGSAFTATVAHIWNEVQDVIPKPVRDRVLPMLENVSHLHPLSPATFPNPTHNMAWDSPFPTSPETVALMDSGMDNNIPFVPLLRPERHVDIVLALDASQDIGADPWLRRGSEHAKKLDLPFPEIPETLPTGTSTYVCPDRTVVYLPLVKNEGYDPELDPKSTAWCATHNFTFEEGQTEKLWGLAERGVDEVAEDLKQAVREVWKRKRNARLGKERDERGPLEEF
ncbi:hypothetical protein HKX48_005579 [Thoreauomyces humboldtii]|nr:hypothetical protein HKX48_005579 [Thoreauomyces humboldtii]